MRKTMNAAPVIIPNESNKISTGKMIIPKATHKDTGPLGEIFK